MLIKNTSLHISNERFESDLLQHCGSFEIRPSKGISRVVGGISAHKNDDLDVVMVDTNLQQIIRSQKNIRNDTEENYFLIIQQQGRALMAQGNLTAMLLPGDMILIDSRKESEFTFFGDQSKQISFHLPQYDMHERFNTQNIQPFFLSNNDPTSIAIHAVIKKSFQKDVNSNQNHFLKEAFLNLIGSFLYDRSHGIADRRNDDLGQGGSMIGQALEYIDHHFKNPGFCASDAADALNISIRQFQRGFKHLGSTPTKYIISKRLEYAKLRLENKLRNNSKELISEIIYDSGFSDISYFNRSFQNTFGCSPSQYSLKN